MASWGAIIAWSDFHYSGVEQKIHFTDRPGEYFWSNGYSWGICKVTKKNVTLEVLYGELPIKEISIGEKHQKVTAGKLKKGDILKIKL
jgi:hypothetical protein